MQYLSISDAALWAACFAKKNVTPSNITYLIQYGRIKKHSIAGTTVVSQQELEQYYKNYKTDLQSKYTEKLGEDIYWTLAFHNVKEMETTKHVHRLHPYKGNFIPQLVEHFGIFTSHPTWDSSIIMNSTSMPMSFSVFPSMKAKRSELRIRVKSFRREKTISMESAE
jgi:hypothetical protein